MYQRTSRCSTRSLSGIVTVTASVPVLRCAAYPPLPGYSNSSKHVRPRHHGDLRGENSYLGTLIDRDSDSILSLRPRLSSSVKSVTVAVPRQAVQRPTMKSLRSCFQADPDRSL
eukprot:2718714-Rhodomonas_salina.3